MILFWLICAGLVAIALAFILPALLQNAREETAEAERSEANVDVYRDQLSELEADLRNGIMGPEQYQQERDEIERRLLDDVSTATESTEGKTKQSVSGRAPVYGLALGIPIVAVVLYLLLGNSAALSGTTSQTPMAGQQANGQITQEGIAANVEKLAKRLEQNPNDPEGWTMLARSYLNLQKYSEASNAYAKATSLKSSDADLWTEYAFAMAMANGRQLEGQPRELIKKALQIDPENAKALELAGSAEFQVKNYAAAIDYWQRLLKKVHSDPELTRSLTERINEAKSLAGASAK